MTTHKINNVRIFVAGQEIGVGDIVLKVEQEAFTLEIDPQKIRKRALTMQEMAERFTPEIKPVDIYIGDPGPGKKKAQWKKEQRRFRK